MFGDYSFVLKHLFSIENEIFSSFLRWNWKLNKKFFLKRLSFQKEKHENAFLSLNISLVLIFLVFFFFLKNFLIFNAEKLMLIYFIFISIAIFFFARSFLFNFLNDDLQKFLTILLQIEWEGEKTLLFFKQFLIKLKNFLISTQLEFLLVKNFELKLLKK